MYDSQLKSTATKVYGLWALRWARLQHGGIDEDFCLAGSITLVFLCGDRHATRGSILFLEYFQEN